METLLQKLTRKTVSLGLRCPGTVPLARRLRGAEAAIVMYHGVTAVPLPADNWCQLDAAEFARQVEYLARHYTLLPLREIVERLRERRPLPRRPAALTFDDGFRNVFTTALPVLRRCQAPAMVFLVTSLVGTRQPAWPDRLFHTVVHCPQERIDWGGTSWDLATPAARAAAYRGLAARLKLLPGPQREAALGCLLQQLGGCRAVEADSPLATLAWEEIEEMRRSGLIEFGSHTHTHPILSRCDRQTQHDELRTSRDVLRERLGRADLFAYPNGGRDDFTPQTRQLLVELGYRAAVSTVPGLNGGRADLYALRRVPVGSDSTVSQFARNLLGF
jgi:peptidoglycan/xylan/chitin deacetylase (PgdA/CDA1 family)